MANTTITGDNAPLEAQNAELIADLRSQCEAAKTVRPFRCAHVCNHLDYLETQRDAGKIDPANLQAILQFIAAILPMILALFGPKK